MKKLIFIFFLLIGFQQYAQIIEPVTWETHVEKVSEQEYHLISTATIEEGWHLYSQKVPEDGPISTTFNYNPQEGLSFVDKTQEEAGHVVYDPVFEMEIKFFEDKTIFIQKVKVESGITSVEGFVEFMACDDTQCTPPTEEDLVFDLTKATELKTLITTGSNHNEKENDTTKTSEKSEDDSSKKRSYLGTFLLAFIFGFAALLTPCVFPMIPMTVSFFTKQSKTKSAGIRNAIIYGVSIIVIYVILGTLVSLAFGPSALNALSTNVWFNLLFFALLIVFAFSFLGAFEIVLPSSWGTKVDAKADKGGLIGIFFMALALAIVSFSCTGPIVGSILVQAAQGGDQTGPIIGMLGFSTAIALPFALFAAFPGWMNSLPKSGGWLNTVKVVLGFLELAFAFKFLSNADLVYQLHWLEREVFLAIWIAIFGALTLYLFGKIKLPHDSPLSHISVGRLSLGLLSLSFTLYMLPGLWGAPLNLISAFPPAQHYAESPYGVGFTKLGDGEVSQTIGQIPEGGHLLPPHNILTFNDYDLGLAYAKKVGKPVMIDFTGHACVNCRKMEQNVWVKPEVLSVLKNEVVLISLYVDDKRPLPEGEIIESQLKPGKKLKYIGQKWSEFQAVKYKINSQPFYVLMGHDEENLNEPVAYTPDVEEYLAWLKEGVSNFRSH